MAYFDLFKDNKQTLVFVVCMIAVFSLDPYKTSTGHMLFYLFEIAMVIFVIVSCNRRNAFKQQAIILLFCLTTIIIAVTGGPNSFKVDDIFENIKNNSKTSLLELTLHSDDPNVVAMSDVTFMSYFFRDKTIVVENEADKEIVASILENTYGDIYFNYRVIEKSDIKAKDFVKRSVNLFDSYIDQNGNIYVVDGNISSSSIVFFSDNNISYFIPEELIINNEDANTLESISFENAVLNSRSSFAIPFETYNKIVQFAAVLFMFIVGLVISIALWNQLNYWMLSLIALPIGTVVWTFAGIIIACLRIPYTLLSQILVIFLLIFIIIWFNKIRGVNYKKLALYCLPVMFVLLYYVFSKYTAVSYDSIYKIRLGLLLAINRFSTDFFTNVAIYGLIEPYCHSLGYLLGGDYLYTLYPMFNIIAICLVICGIGMILDEYVFKKEFDTNKTHIVIVFLMGIIVLITNCDFRYGKFYVMSHDIVSVYFLIFIIFTIQYKFLINNRIWGMIFSSIAIMVTRTEGILYVLFLTTLSVCYLENKEIIKKQLIIYGLCYLWTCIQLYMYNGNSGDGYFFSRRKALVLLFCISAALCLHFFIFIKRYFEKLIPYYYELYFVGLFCIVVFISIAMERQLATENIGTYISHFSSYIEGGANSGYIWAFVFLSAPILLAMNTELSKYSICVICGYILLVFLIFLFRSDLPMHEGFGDSGRRMLVHIMPSAVFLVITNIIKGFCVEREDVEYA